MGAVSRMTAMVVLVAAVFVPLSVDLTMAATPSKVCEELSTQDPKKLSEYQLATVVNCGGEAGRKAAAELKKRLASEASKRPDQFKTRQIVPFTYR